MSEVEPKKIVGSVNRPHDFDCEFRPKKFRPTHKRWKQIYKIWYSNGCLPPIKLYRIKREYFVQDGHHRVSVLKSFNVDRIEAKIKEYIPSKDTHENRVYLRSKKFKKEYGLELQFSDISIYEKMEKLIENFADRYSIPDKKYAAEKWYCNLDK